MEAHLSGGQGVPPSDFLIAPLDDATQGRARFGGVTSADVGAELLEQVHLTVGSNSDADALAEVAEADLDLLVGLAVEVVPTSLGHVPVDTGVIASSVELSHNRCPAEREDRVKRHVPDLVDEESVSFFDAHAVMVVGLQPQPILHKPSSQVERWRRGTTKVQQPNHNLPL